jgi:dipeptidyl aminopeptidase/acylaminoacyl peptidase
VVLLRADGSKTRRLSDDAFKDRGPTWSPDGKTLGFYSTRSGRWEAWTIRSDGSDLRQLTDMNKNTSAITWAPDGKHAIVSNFSTRTVWRLDPSRLNSLQTAELLRAPVEAGFLEVSAWSNSGTLLAGLVFASQESANFGVWDLANGVLRKLDVPVDLDKRAWINFLPDSRRLLMNGPHGLTLVDLTDGKPHVLRPGPTADQYHLSRDGRTLVIQHPVFDSDIWLMEFTKPGR